MKRDGDPHSVGDNIMDCDIIVSEFEFQMYYYILFQANTHLLNCLITTASELRE